MPALSLSILGPYSATLDGNPLGKFRTRPSQALFIYLVCEPGRHRREQLMTFFWPGLPQTSAQQNLRQNLYLLRQTVPAVTKVNGQGTTPFVLSDNESLQLNPEAAVNDDVRRFVALIDRIRPGLGELEEAVALYRGDFLSDFYLPDSNPFEEWAAARRETFRQGILFALERLTAAHLSDENFAAAEACARRQLDVDPLNGTGHQQLIETLARSGRRSAALAHFNDYRRLLHIELGVKPGSETLALINAVQAGELLPASRRPDYIRGYDIHEELGRGSFGAVYRASQPAIGRDVAIKVIPARYADDIAFIRRFEAEAQIIARLEHPQIVPLYDYWREPGSAYLVMRYLRGGNLKAALDGAPWEPARVARLLDQVAAALSVAHCNNVVHRDVKPANILLDEDGNAYLTDFGIAKLLQPQGGTVTAYEGFAGTPEYVSPEHVLNEDATPLSDQYSLGLVVYEALSGRPPFTANSLSELLEMRIREPLPSLREQLPNIPAAVEEVLGRATAREPAERYPDVTAFARAFRAAIASGTPVWEAASPTESPLNVTNPYKGLLAFTEADAAMFYGREELTQQLIERLAETGEHQYFLAVVGPSGSGKSSLIKAGLVPALRQGALPGSENWFVLDMMPGAHPYEELETAFLRIAVNPPASLLEQLRDGERGLLRAVRRTLPPDDDSRLLLIIDQFEELFTLVPDREVTARFLDALVTAVSEPRSPLQVIITVRADFYDRPLLYPGLSELMQARTEVVIPLAADELVRAIERPAAQAGVTFQPELVAALVAEVNEQPGALPLLQYTLSELFERREGNRLTLSNYRGLGGISGALAQRAESVYDGLDANGCAAVRALFSRLVTLGEGVEDTRRRVLRVELEALGIEDEIERTKDRESELRTSFSQSSNPLSSSSLVAAIEAYGQARLLSFDSDPITRGPTVEIAHEALLRAWPRLREWLDEGRAALRLSRLLTQAATEWEAAECADGFLLRGARLDQLAPLATGDIALTETERRFLSVSLSARQARREAEEARRQAEITTALKLAETERQRADEQGRAARRLQQRAALLAGALGLALILAVAAMLLSRRATTSAQLAQANANVAQTAEARALDQGATAEAERIRAEVGQAVALAAEATAAAEAVVRVTAEAVAIREQQAAEQQARLATSRALASAALNNLSVDPELSLLLALQAMSTVHTFEAENALHEALPAQHLIGTLPNIGVNNRFAISPDSQYLALAGRDKTVTVWSMSSVLAGAPESVILPMTAEIGDIHFNPDGSSLTTFGADGAVRVLNPVTGTVLSTFPGFPSLSGFAGFPHVIQAHAINPDNTRLAIADLDGNTIIRDIESGRELSILSGQPYVQATGISISIGSIIDMAFSPDGTRLATGGADGMAKIWDTNSGQELAAVAGHINEITAVSFSPDGQRLATAGIDGTARIWDISSDNSHDQPIHILSHEQAIFGMAFSPDGSRLAAGDRSGGVTVWDVASGRKLLDLIGHTGVIYWVQFSPDGLRLVTSSQDETVKIWDVAPGRELATLVGPGGPVGGPGFSPDGLYLATGHGNGDVMIWERSSGQLLFTLRGHSEFVTSLAFSRDGARLASASWDSTARVWDMEAIVAGDMPEPMILEGHTDRVWNLEFDPDGSRLITGSADGTARIWDVRSGELLASITDHGGRIQSLDLSSDGKRLATAGGGGFVRVWDLTSTAETIDQAILSLPVDSFIYYVAFSPDGSRLAVGKEEGPTTVWDISGAEGRVLFELAGHSSAVTATAFSPDGSRLATAGFDSSVKVWDMTQQGQELLSLSAHTDAAIGVAFSPDGTQLASASFDGTARVYVLDVEELVVLANSRLTRWWRPEECLRYLHTDACPPAPERFSTNN